MAASGVVQELITPPNEEKDASKKLALRAIHRVSELMWPDSSSKPHWVALTGPSGAGKTRLLQGMLDLMLKTSLLHQSYSGYANSRVRYFTRFNS